MESPAKVFGAVLALTAFAVAAVAGLASGVPAGELLLRAILSMTVCYPVGLVLGFAAGWALDEHIERHKASRPIPDVAAVAEQYDLEHADA